MNYEKIYDAIVARAVTAQRSKTLGYYESHHIIPRPLGGSDDRGNLVLLTAREHFLCHYLLVKINRHNKYAHANMLHAFMLMRGANEFQTRYLNSRLYEAAKVQYSQVRSEARAGTPLTEEHKRRIAESVRAINAKRGVSQETRDKIAEKASTRKRKPFSEEYRQHMSALMKERHRWKDKASV